MTAAELESNTPTFSMDQRLIAGRYRLHDQIGSGRLGEIFAAFDESYSESGVKKQLAIQIVPEDIVRNNKLFNKLNVGYSALRTAAHPNIVKYLRFGRHGRRGYVAMELLDGAPLTAVLANAETLPKDEVKPVIRSVGEALEFLHAQGTVHGNITTANVFFTGELEVLLLDVLPIGADQAVIRGGSTSSSFSRCTVRDDVFGLACLVYEMLAGKHPYNYSPPAEASQAGLEPDRIDSLTDAEWDALRRALSLDHELRTSSISDFMRDFGVSRTERLRPVAAQPARQEFSSYPAAANSPTVAVPAEPAPISEPVATVAAVDPVITSEDNPQKSRPRKSNARTRRTVLLGILLATLGSWSYYGQPGEQIATLVERANETVVSALPELQSPAAETTVLAPARSVATERVAPVDTAPAAKSSGEGATAVVAEVMESEPEPVAIVEPLRAAPVPADSVPATNDTTTAGPAEAESAPRIESPGIATDGTLADAEVDPVDSDPGLAFAEPVISVSERDGAARIAAPTTGYSESPLVWWTSEHSARAGEDFIAVQQQLLDATMIDDQYTLLVPLVNDSLPEPRESFFVSIGFREPQQGRIERVATVRVDIVDDD